MSASLLVVAVIGTWLLIVIRAMEGPAAGLGARLGLVAFALAAAVTVLAAIYIGAISWASISRRRGETLQLAEPDAVVFASGRVPHLIRGLKRAGYDKRFDFVAANLPYGLSFVGNKSGFRVYGGSARAPFEYFTISWAETTVLARITVQEFGRVTPAILVVVRPRNSEAPIELPFIVLGRGPGGLFPKTPAAIDESLTLLSRWRQGVTT